MTQDAKKLWRQERYERLKAARYERHRRFQSIEGRILNAWTNQWLSFSDYHHMLQELIKSREFDNTQILDDLEAKLIWLELKS
jgi:hypothetical protein